MYPQALDIGCFSHTLDNAGSKIATPVLSEFMISCVSLFSHSPKARLAWVTCTGIAIKTYSKTRWWSKWEMIKQLMALFGDVQPFLEHNDVGAATREKMLSILRSEKKVQVKVKHLLQVS